MDQRGRSLSASRPHIRHSPSPSPHASFDPSTSNGLGLDPSQFNQLPNQPYDLNQNNFNQQPDLFAGLDNSSSQQSLNSTINPSFLNDNLNPNNTLLDPALFDPNTLMNQMATSQAHSPTPPHLLQPGMHRPASVSPHHSPNLSQGGFPSPHHSRHASLDPSSAAYPVTQQNSEWGNMMFPGHHRAPSDTFSDVSSSAHPSPYMGNLENFDDNNNPSPLLHAQQDPALFQESIMNFNQFNLNENRSPGHSPHMSPRLDPQQQPLPQFTPADNYGLNQGIYSQGSENFPTLNNDIQDYGGNADQMSPPEINIEFAPQSRTNSFEPPKETRPPGDALSPPDRCKHDYSLTPDIL